MALVKTGLTFANGTTPAINGINLNKIVDLTDEIVDEIDSPTNSVLASSTATITSLPSTARDGEVAIDGKGNIATNAVTNGDFSDGTTGWLGVGGTLTASTNELTLTVSDLVSGDINQTLSQSTVAGNKYFVVAEILPKYANTTQLRIGAVSTPITVTANSWNRIYVVTQAVSATTTFLVQHTFTSNYIVGDTVKFRSVMAIPMTGTQYESFTADQMNEAFPSYFDGTKGSQKHRVRVIGKNLFDKSIIDDGYTLSGTLDGSITLLADRFTTGYIRISPSLSYKSSQSYRRYAYYDSNKNVISGADVIGTALTSPANAAFIKLTYVTSTTTIDTLQLELGSTETPYDPYSKTESYCPVTLNSVPAISDTYDYNLSEHGQNVSGEHTLLSGDMTTLDVTQVNSDIVFFSLETLPNLSTSTSTLSFAFSGEDTRFNQLSAPNSLVTGVYSNASGLIRLVVPKGTYPDLASARTALAGTKIYYQLATPIITKYLPRVLQASASGTIYQEPVIEDWGYYTTSISVDDTSYPIASLESVWKINPATGTLTAIDLADCTVAVDGLSFTISGAIAGEYYLYSYEHSKDTTLARLDYTYNTNLKAQVNSNTKQIREVDEKVNIHSNLIEANRVEVEKKFDLAGGTITGATTFSEKITEANSRHRVTGFDGANNHITTYSADDTDIIKEINRVGANNYKQVFYGSSYNKKSSVEYEILDTLNIANLEKGIIESTIVMGANLVDRGLTEPLTVVSTSTNTAILQYSGYTPANNFAGLYMIGENGNIYLIVSHTEADVSNQITVTASENIIYTNTTEVILYARYTVNLGSANYNKLYLYGTGVGFALTNAVITKQIANSFKLDTGKYFNSTGWPFFVNAGSTKYVTPRITGSTLEVYVAMSSQNNFTLSMFCEQ